MEMEVTFPEGKKVNAAYNGFTIATDQAKADGGNGSAPEPFTLFLASIGTCAGVYVVYFCEERGIDASTIRITVHFDWNEDKHLVDKVQIHLHLPSDFPEKYKKTIAKVAGLCSVKRNILDPPDFEIVTETTEAEIPDYRADC